MRYKNVFLFGSLQEVVATQSKYFIQNTEKIVIYYITPRLSKERNYIQLYRKGKLVKEEGVTISDNIFLCYAYIYYHYISALFRYFSSKEKVVVISYHPICFFLKSFWNLFRKYEIVYWVGDYFPKNSLHNTFYQSIADYYHKSCKYRLYLSDRLNKKMNGKLVSSDTTKTVMWGVEDKTKYRKKKLSKEIVICFIGLLKYSQGIDRLLLLIKDTQKTSLKLLGFAQPDINESIRKFISDNKLQKRIYFPNKSFYADDLRRQIVQCDIGIAFYDISVDNGTYYADPAKIKTYAQYGLPVIMTDVSDITKYIKTFHAGEIVATNIASQKSALDKIRKNYKYYQEGVKKFVSYFQYEKYYNEQFLFLESFWKNEK